MRRVRHRWLSLLRVVVVGLFMWGLVLQPVLAAAGEMHELAHDPSGQHAHVLHGTGPGTADEPEDGLASTLHLLLHFAHCCGATVALMPMLKPAVIAPAQGPLTAMNVLVSPPAYLPSPFKPPIFR